MRETLSCTTNEALKNGCETIGSRSSGFLKVVKLKTTKVHLKSLSVEVSGKEMSMISIENLSTHKN